MKLDRCHRCGNPDVFGYTDEGDLPTCEDCAVHLRVIVRGFVSGFAPPGIETLEDLVEVIGGEIHELELDVAQDGPNREAP